MTDPRHHNFSESQIRTRLESPQSAFLDQIVAEPTEFESGFVVLGMWASYFAKPHESLRNGALDIKEARSVAVAMLHAEVNRSEEN